MNSIRNRKKSLALFDLIKSLTGQEKRYFSLFSKRHIIGNGNNYKRLFDDINSQEVYNEMQVIKMLPNKKFAKHIDRHKNYLYKLILKSLRVFHSQKTLSIDMREQLDHIELLIYKNQWSQCERHIVQAKHFAEENDLFTGYIEVMGLEMDLMQSKSDRKWLEHNIDDIRIKENGIIAGNFVFQDPT